jgi:hypothetical protein
LGGGGGRGGGGSLHRLGQDQAPASPGAPGRSCAPGRWSPRSPCSGPCIPLTTPRPRMPRPAPRLVAAPAGGCGFQQAPGRQGPVLEELVRVHHDGPLRPRQRVAAAGDQEQERVSASDRAPAPVLSPPAPGRTADAAVARGSSDHGRLLRACQMSPVTSSLSPLEVSIEGVGRIDGGSGPVPLVPIPARAATLPPPPARVCLVTLDPRGRCDVTPADSAHGHICSLTLLQATS